ncbi:MAG TPA: 3-deoxy-manno-octulosonate cytidylyltransferase [Candidatus Acidoferrales bacterium]|nr:3-deoxy-manno-octulosonate cytidylyltransferase [Candidatus Acidoferrales bacterium]
MAPPAQSKAPEAKVLVVVPARHASSRFPGKPLAPIAGKPMIQHVVERIREARLVTDVLVATDDARIKTAVEAFGGEAMLTRADHRTGTDRVAEVAVQREADIYVNVQGDEPLIDPGTIDAVAAAMIEDESIRIATACAAIIEKNDIMDPHVTKVVRDFDGNALYFSHAPIPWVRESSEHLAVRHWKHLGLYAFRRDALLEFPTLPPGDLERAEQLEQLRWLENGFRIEVVETEYDAVSVDVPADIERVEKLLREGSA